MALDELKLAEDITVDTDDVQIVLGEYMWDHTSFRIGGAADVYVRPLSEEGLLVTLEHCRLQKAPFMIFGKGTNLLVSDRGFRGVMIDMTGLDGMTAEENRITASCGTALAAIARGAAEHALSGLEFAAGIPGSLGGGIFMNAGAYGGEMKDVVRSVRVLKPDLSIAELPADELGLGYRKSRFKESGEIILSAELELVPGVREEIEARMKELNERRREKQPLELPSAGSAFKRPEGYFAGKLIQDAGLSGYQVGKAQISPKHCGFIVNRGGASARDVYRLIRDVQEKVKECSGVDLEPEIAFVGEFT